MVSIIVPVYNTGGSIRKCIESLIHQSYENIEILLIDDGSDFETAAICDSLGQEYGKLTVYHCKNQGVSAARNYGIERARGKYIFFADADDYVEPKMLEVMVGIAERSNVQLVIAGYYFDTPYLKRNNQIYECIEQKVATIKIESKEQLKNELVYLWDSSLMYNVWNKLFDLEIVRDHNISFPVGKGFNEDRDFIREYLKHIETAFVTEECFYHYIRENDLGATGIYRSDMLAIRKEEFHCLKEFFDDFGIYSVKAREYVSREHFDRIVGTVENIFHSNMSNREIKCKIQKIMDDDDTKYAMMYAKPKSKKMKVMYLMFRTHNVDIVYLIMKLIYLLRIKYPVLFYKLRQSR